VTQPAARRDRGKKLTLSPLANYALERGFSSHLIFTPQRAGDVTNYSFLILVVVILTPSASGHNYKQKCIF
jgi:methionyl-tRNA formyltransferase